MNIGLAERIELRAAERGAEKVDGVESNIVECEVCTKKVHKDKAIKQGDKFLCGYSCMERWIEE